MTGKFKCFAGKTQEPQRNTLFYWEQLLSPTVRTFMNIHMLFKSYLAKYRNMLIEWCLMYLSKSTFCTIVVLGLPMLVE